MTRDLRMAASCMSASSTVGAMPATSLSQSGRSNRHVDSDASSGFLCPSRQLTRHSQSTATGPCASAAHALVVSVPVIAWTGNGTADAAGHVLVNDRRVTHLLIQILGGVVEKRALSVETGKMGQGAGANGASHGRFGMVAYRFTEITTEAAPRDAADDSLRTHVSVRSVPRRPSTRGTAQNSPLVRTDPSNANQFVLSTLAALRSTSESRRASLRCRASSRWSSDTGSTLPASRHALERRHQIGQ
jgi:hypothetical protein